MRPALMRSLADLARDSRGSSAVEFALVCVPLVFILMMILQMGIYYMAKSSLDAGVIETADVIVCAFNANSNATTTTSSISVPSSCSTAASDLSGTSLKALVASQSGGLVHNDATLAVDLRGLTTLSAAIVPITDRQVDTSQSNKQGASLSLLVLRAESQIPWFLPWISLGALGGSCAGTASLPCVRASAIVRRQN